MDNVKRAHVMDHGTDSFLLSTSSLVIGMLTGRKTAHTGQKKWLNSKESLKDHGVICWYGGSENMTEDSRPILKYWWWHLCGKSKNTYCIFRVLLKCSLSTGHCTIVGEKTQLFFKSPSLPSLCFIFQKHPGCMKLAIWIVIFRSSKRKIKMNISVVCYTRAA